MLLLKDEALLDICEKKKKKKDCCPWTHAVNIAPDQGAEGQGDPKLVGNEVVVKAAVGHWPPN